MKYSQVDFCGLVMTHKIGQKSCAIYSISHNVDEEMAYGMGKEDRMGIEEAAHLTVQMHPLQCSICSMTMQEVNACTCSPCVSSLGTGYWYACMYPGQ